MDATALEFESVSFHASGTAIVSEISFSIAAGEKTCLTGPSGSGKSTLLRLAMGILQPVDGSIHINGTPVSTDNLADLRRRIAYIDQDAVMGAEEVRSALLLPFNFTANHGAEPGEEFIRETLERVALEESILDKRIADISGGERQRIALARALLLKKKIFITDEITSSLDPDNRRQITRLLLALEATVLAVTHDQEFLDEYDRVIRLERGRIQK